MPRSVRVGACGSAALRAVSLTSERPNASPDSLHVVSEATASTRKKGVQDRPWFRATLIVQLALFMIPAVIAWTSSLNRTAYIPLVALSASLLVGMAMLVPRVWRGAGGRIIAATLLAAALEVGLIFLLIIAYGTTHSGWDLS
jgi:hypothetical protein